MRLSLTLAVGSVIVFRRFPSIDCDGVPKVAMMIAVRFILLG